jgi:hypothetical protein
LLVLPVHAVRLFVAETGLSKREKTVMMGIMLLAMAVRLFVWRKVPPLRISLIHLFVETESEAEASSAR